MNSIINHCKQMYNSNYYIRFTIISLITFIAGLLIFKNQLFYSNETIANIDVMNDGMYLYSYMNGDYIPDSLEAIVDVPNLQIETNQIIFKLDKEISDDAICSLYIQDIYGNLKLIEAKPIKKGATEIEYNFQYMLVTRLQFKVTSIDQTRVLNLPKVSVEIDKKEINFIQKSWRYLFILLGVFCVSIMASILVFLLNKNEGEKGISTERESNIELLRVISMFAIILHHCVVHGGAMNMDYCNNKVIANVFVPIGKICFDAFIAISMWFLVDNRFNWNRFIKTWLQVWFYSVLLTVISVLMDNPINIKNIMSSFLPIAGNSHGFAAAYLLFYLLYPFLHLLLDSLNKNKARILLFLTFYAQIGSQIIGNYNGYKQNFSSEIGLFIFCFILSYNLKKWPPVFIIDYKVNLLIFMFVWIICFQCNAMMYLWNDCSDFVSMVLSLAQDESSIIMILGGYALFFFMLNIKIRKNRFVNTLASYTFGILLIHDHNFFRRIFWNDIVMPKRWFYSSFFIIHLVFSAMCIFYVCAVIDFLRKNILEKVVCRSKIYKKFVQTCTERWK